MVKKKRKKTTSSNILIDEISLQLGVAAGRLKREIFFLEKKKFFGFVFDVH